MTNQEADTRYERSLTLPNDVQTVPQLAEFVEEVCETTGLDMGTAMKMNLAIEEAVVNIVHYSKAEWMEMTARVKRVKDGAGACRLEVTLRDNGIPFDPTQQAEVDVAQVTAERQIGGLGIALVRKIADEVQYRRDNDINTLTILKNI